MCAQYIPSTGTAKVTCSEIDLKMMRFRQLGNTDMRVSILGMGGSGFGNVYGKYNEEEAKRAIRQAFGKGINYIDTAVWYGQGKSESFLGRALSGIPRSAFYIATKVGRYERDVQKMFDFSAEKVTSSAWESLKRLQLQYVDVLQVHDVEFAPSLDVIIDETLPALQKLKEQGLCRYIGITGYPLGPLKEVITRSPVRVDSVLTYCRLTLNDSSLRNDFEFFRAKGVSIINASSVGMGLLTKAGVQYWHPASSEIKEACSAALRYCEDQGVDIGRIATNYSASFEEVYNYITVLGLRHLGVTYCCNT